MLLLIAMSSCKKTTSGNDDDGGGGGGGDNNLAENNFSINGTKYAANATSYFYLNNEITSCYQLNPDGYGGFGTNYCVHIFFSGKKLPTQPRRAVTGLGNTLAIWLFVICCLFNRGKATNARIYFLLYSFVAFSLTLY